MSETSTASAPPRQGLTDKGPTPRRAAAIALEGLHKRFGPDSVALDGVDLTIREGEFFTLLGPSGCGKTTLLRILAGLESPDAGRLTLGGRDITQVPAHRRSVNTVFQSYALFPHLSVRENLAFGLRMQGVAKPERESRVAEIARFIQLGELIERRVDQLSGGQRQRIALARALVCEPDVLLLDEPLSALDAGLRGQLQVELKRVQERLGMTFLFVTHDQQEAMVMSDRIAVLDGGCIQQVGSPREVYERPANAFVARFMGHDNLFPIHSRHGVRLNTDLGALTVESPASEPPETPDADSLLLIRPETVDLLPSDQAGANCLPARVTDCLYRGSHAEYRLAVGDAELQAMVNNRGRQLPGVGDRVCVSVAAEDLVTLTGEEGT
ncbi:spermidine/putrescine transport system ATP-binding protein [Onishia taeanensis]|uniref:Spermidine/putrescine import ATP-binding protein PotA n=1 Tax=Onishia taeanensis TaxID=284577 RepID=A0A328Y736_9GAMM|nr:ABC transporter ATP-binding protein [Halomonas taeanensis]RAR64545.1 spermidine/putrescine transport system ATP-binding protein [Halomonas taeanensis]